MKRIKDKISEIEQFVSELESITPATLDEYSSGIEKRAACERYVEKIVEAATDLAFLVIKQKRLKIPEDDIDAFNILLSNDIINESLSKRLKNAKGMRNILAHQYGKIDDRIVFEAIANEIGKDIAEFIRAVKPRN